MRIPANLRIDFGPGGSTDGPARTQPETKPSPADTAVNDAPLSVHSDRAKPRMGLLEPPGGSGLINAWRPSLAQALRVTYQAGFVASAAACAYGAVGDLENRPSAGEALLAALQIGAGVLTADLLTATFHWLEDTYLAPREGLAKSLRRIAVYNEVHHIYPQSVTGANTYESMQSLLPPVVAVFCLCDNMGWLGPFTASLLGASLWVNEIHKMAHTPDAQLPAWARTMQKLRLIQTPATHRQHHRNPDKNYGVMLEVTNPIYENIGLWRALEWAAERLFGAVAETKGTPGESSVNGFSIALRDPTTRVLGVQQRTDALAERVARHIYGAPLTQQDNVWALAGLVGLLLLKPLRTMGT